ncbi:MAG: sulfite exporter TauE/SafE family protein [Clostridia bacterium]|nr:sulfite exporter TauE/SafE family protein [Clostridia bacterium]
MLILVAIISGTLAGMGIGGGALFVILSTIFLGFDQKYAQTINLIMFMSVGISATISNIKDKKVDFKLVKKMLPLLIVGALIGTWIVTKIESKNLRTYFSYFLVAIGIYEIITSLKRIKKAKNNTNQ